MLLLMISAIKKDSVEIATEMALESIGIYSTTELNKVTKAKNKLKSVNCNGARHRCQYIKLMEMMK